MQDGAEGRCRKNSAGSDDSDDSLVISWLGEPSWYKYAPRHQPGAKAGTQS